MRTLNRGVSHWPFIITLVLLLVFIFLWYGQKSDADAANATIATLQKKIDFTPDATHTGEPGLNQNIGVYEDWADKVSKLVGWQTKTLLPGSKPVSNPDKIADALNPDKEGSAIKAVKDAATVSYVNATFKQGKGTSVPATSVQKLSQAFKDKVKAVINARPIEGPPAPPVDPDDAADVARYNSKLA